MNFTFGVLIVRFHMISMWTPLTRTRGTTLNVNFTFRVLIVRVHMISMWTPLTRTRGRGGVVIATASCP